MSSNITGPKGAPDLLPPGSAVNEQVVERAVELFRTFGFSRIDTPVFESTELFQRGLAEGSDIVTKEMYTFEDKGGRSLTLRPDMTAPVVRAILEHSLDRAGLPVKVYYVAPIFRHERPQAGRYRQFTQVGVEAVGAEGPEIDAEVIALAADVLGAVGLPGCDLFLNSIGHTECRASYMPALRQFLVQNQEELCEDCRRKIDTNPLRAFDCKIPADREIMKNAPLVTDFLCDSCKMHYESVKDLLAAAGVSFIEEPRLVRGLDYYSRTAFEFTAPGLGAQNAVGAGGRYDGLSQQLGGPSEPGIGFGLGVERIVLALNDSPAAQGTRVNVFFVSIGDRARRQAFLLAMDLRRKGISADIDHAGRAVKGQFKAADRSGARWAAVMGDKEIDAGEVTLKEMATGEERLISAGELAAVVGGSK